ncbi:MAG: hypothetical protein GY768_04015 [Planctomycetaceae bacterium]|nr:hypothetical protein [Planctomycetaceae bacterium]
MDDYEHTQPGTMIRGLLGATMLFLVIPVSLLDPADFAGWILAMVSVFLLPILITFHSLSVQVTDDRIGLKFGVGLIQKKFQIDQVLTARMVRNSWWSGWGIRRFSGGWLYNVSGFEAVEIKLRDNRIARIGTDEPQRLLEAIEARILRE